MIGPSELVFVLAIPALLFAFPRVRSWCWPMLGCLTVAAVVTPPDPFTLLLVAAPLFLALVAGVYLAPYLRRPHGA